MMETNELTKRVIGLAIEVHKTLGPGMLESSYEACLMYELLEHQINAEPQATLPLNYKGKQIQAGYRVDISIPSKLIIELKAVEKILPIHIAQTITYMKLSGIQTGLIINFNASKLINGIKRLKL